VNLPLKRSKRESVEPVPKKKEKRKMNLPMQRSKRKSVEPVSKEEFGKD